MTHGSLFSGIGGIDLGFEMAEIQTLWTCEINEWCNEILEKRFPDATQYKDIKDIGKHNLQPVDIISGGFPCQDISQAGKGQGLKGARSGLWFEMWRIISELRPRWVLIENVPALTYRGGTRVLHDLAEIRYDAEWQIISARDVGAKHLRKRMWIVAYPQQISDPCSEGFQGQLHSIEIKDRNTTRKRCSGKSSIQRRDSELSDTNSSRYRGGSSKECGDKRKGELQQEEQKRSSIRSKAKGRNNSSTQRRREDTKLSDTECISRQNINKRVVKTKKRKSKTFREKNNNTTSKHKNERNKQTSKRGTKQDIERQDNRDGKFRIKTFEILKNEPRLDRVAYGLSNKVDRYKDRVQGLGNSVVPQIPYLIGRRLIKLQELKK